MDLIAIAGTVISWGERIFKAFKYLFQWGQQGSMRNYKKRYEKGMQIIKDDSDKVIQFLYNYYATSNTAYEQIFSVRYLFQDGHSQDLALITRPNLLLTTNPDFNLESTYGGLVKHFSVQESEILKGKKRWDALGMAHYEGHKYSLHSIADNRTLEFRDTTFYTYRTAFGEIYDELAIALADKGINKFVSLNKSKYRSLLPKRTKYLSTIDTILNLNQRICIGGIITMVAARTNNDIAIIAQRRSTTVSDEPNSLTLVPRAYHESLITPDQEYVLKTTVYREFYEELFEGDKDVGHHMEPDFYMAENSGIRELVEGDGTNHILKPIGLVWDLYRGNFIVAYCLFIQDQNWWSRYGRAMKLNWEYSETEKISAARASRSEILRLINRKDWAHDSYFAFIEGLRWLATQEPMLASIGSVLPKLHLTNM